MRTIRVRVKRIDVDSYEIRNGSKENICYCTLEELIRVHSKIDEIIKSVKDESDRDLWNEFSDE